MVVIFPYNIIIQTYYIGGSDMSLQSDYLFYQKTRDVDRILVEAWAIVCDAGPVLTQHWVYVSC